MYGQERVVVINNNEYTFKKGTLGYLQTSKDEIKEVSKLLDSSFQTLSSEVPNFGFFKGDVWFKAEIKNKVKEKNLFLHLSNPNLDLVDCYLINEKKEQIYQGHFSDLQDFKNYTFKNRKPIFELNFNENSNSTLLLRVRNNGEQFHFNINFSEKSNFYIDDLNENYFLGIFIGLLIFSFLVNNYMYIMTKDKLSLFYSLYLLALIFLQLSLLGYGKSYIWKNSAYFANIANPLFASISVFFLIHFVRYYLHLNKYFPKLNKLFYVLSICVLINVVLALIPNESSYQISMLFINGMTLILNIAILPIAFSIYRKGFKPAMLFFIAFFVLVLSVFAFVLKNFGILPSNFFTNFGFQIGSAVEVLLFSLGIIIRFKNVQQDAIKSLEEINHLKQTANEELEQKVILRTKEINAQKIEIEEKNKEIVDSITYAKRIQGAILPYHEKTKLIFPSLSIFYQPKDIVSGDFYWIEEKNINGKTFAFMAAADCTGHGVPGAMMSVLCHSILNKVFDETTSFDAGLFLEKTDAYLKRELSRNQQNINDGMDISLLILDKSSNIISFAGANNPLWQIKGNEIIEFEATRRAIGFGGHDENNFNTVSIENTEDSIFLLFTDGLVDQFGGEQGKKLRKKHLREWIVESNTNDTMALRNFIDSKFNQWKMNEAQTDDVTLLIF